ncbi:MAG: hypothetical protein KGJ57_14485 [Sphingomonadales bacterium]|nr:hypothetical protein [Sphingomonadales bacterium]MDE2170611.1 hypothetical protein [Sphingomonadales bacterium]
MDPVRSVIRDREQSSRTATGTIEEKILTLQERKQELADMLWSESGAVAGSGLNDEDIAFLLG